MVDALQVHQLPTDACTVSIRSDVPLLRVGLERAVRLAGLRPVDDPERPDITVRADGRAGAEQVTVTVRSATSRQAWVALGDLIGEFERTFGTESVSDRAPVPRRRDLP